MSLADARRLCDNATPGEWVHLGHGEIAVQDTALYGPIGSFDSEADAEFIAAARTLIPWLIQRIDQLEDAGEMLVHNHNDQAVAVWDGARAALEESA